MKTLHLVGHNHKWNLDSYFLNDIGDGFIFCAYSFPDGFLAKEKLSNHKMEDIFEVSSIDLQYFGKKESGDLARGNLKSYPFHPCNTDGDSATSVYMLTSIQEGIKYQIKQGFTDIIIPNYCENDNIDDLILLVKIVNKWLIKNKKSSYRYFMTIPLTNHTIIDSTKIENILYALTDGDIVFDGYYIVCESKPENKQKVSTDMKYLRNLSRVLSVLKKQNFTTIYAYANWDALVFLSLTNIDYITIATYENLRNFNTRRFLNTEEGGPSKGWYYSEKLLNFVKAQLIDLVREKKSIPIIANEKNIFSDTILMPDFAWNNHKPDIHKNYLLAINKQLKELAAISDLKKRKEFFIQKIHQASEAYDKLESNRVFLLEESKNYHLEIWEAFLLSR